MRKSKKGFTLIELLLTVGLISILSGVILGVVNVGGLRSKTRDSQRKADLKKIQTALELYFADFRSYPTSGWVVLSSNVSNAVTTALSPAYISQLPKDPLHTGVSAGGLGSCSMASTFDYSYYGASGRYVLIAHTEVATSADDSPCNSLPNCAAGALFAGGCAASCSGASGCYGVQNPL